MCIATSGEYNYQDSLNTMCSGRFCQSSLAVGDFFLWFAVVDLRYKMAKSQPHLAVFDHIFQRFPIAHHSFTLSWFWGRHNQILASTISGGMVKPSICDLLEKIQNALGFTASVSPSVSRSQSVGESVYKKLEQAHHFIRYAHTVS